MLEIYSNFFHNLMLIYWQIWKKMETFGKIWEVINKKRPEGRYAFHRGMLINVLMKLANWLISKLANDFSVLMRQCAN